MIGILVGWRRCLLDSFTRLGSSAGRIRSCGRSWRGGYAGWTLRPDRMDRFVLPAHTSVQLVVKVEDSALRPPEFVHGAAVRHTTLEGGCAPRYLQVDLTPFGGVPAFGIPIDRLVSACSDGRGPGRVSRDIEICPLAVMKPARWWP